MRSGQRVKKARGENQEQTEHTISHVKVLDLKTDARSLEEQLQALVGPDHLYHRARRHEWTKRFAEESLSTLMYSQTSRCCDAFLAKWRTNDGGVAPGPANLMKQVVLASPLGQKGQSGDCTKERPGRVHPSDILPDFKDNAAGSGGST